MSILFADIRSFTSISEKMSPEENFKFVNSYLNNIQLKIEEMHRVWGAKQPFMETPTSLGDINLVELDNGIILTPPEGKEYGWVPIALGAETPYGKWQTELDFLYTEDAGLGTIADY